MVIRGAHEYPGAVAVEDELGRVILLHKLPREVTTRGCSANKCSLLSPCAMLICARPCSLRA